MNQMSLRFWEVAPHDILKPEITLPCHTKVKLCDI